MHDGVVLFTSPNISESLGYPRDMWLGRSFIDFVHPKDRSTFASQITSGVALPYSESLTGICSKNTRNSLYVLLRRYRGLQTQGFGVIGKAVSYQPFKLALSFREAPDEARSDNSAGCANNLLVINATPVLSIYSMADQDVHHQSTKFSTRHTASGQLSHVDGASVGAFGYLPQDLIGRSIMDFYHPEDMKLLRDVYLTVMNKSSTAGTSFCSKPYRFLIRNGNYITLETEWTSFVNPWSRKLEFVNGHHRVLKGPKQCDIFSNDLNTPKFADHILVMAKQLSSKILQLMAEPISRPTDTIKNQVSKRCRALASFMETLLNEVSQPELNLDLPLETELTASERDSVMLGEISPHHDYSDSKSSSETPPSYNQLNYNENMQRFFSSKPSTYVGTAHSEDALKVFDVISSPDRANTQRSSDMSPVQRFEAASGDSGSAENCSSGSNGHTDSTTNTSGSGMGTLSDSFQPILLTEKLLIRHNDDMEKCMIKKHREARNRSGDKIKIDKNQDTGVALMAPMLGGSSGAGLKRSCSRSWEASDATTNSKHQHMNETLRREHMPLETGSIQPPAESMLNVSHQSSVAMANMYKSNLWSPYSFGINPLTNNATGSLTQFAPSPAAGLYPAVYLMPAPHELAGAGTAPKALPLPPATSITPYYMAGLMYPNHPPLVYPHMFQAAPHTLQSVSSTIGLPDQLLTNTDTNSFAVIAIILFIKKI